MIMHFSKLVFKKEIIIIEMNQLFCNRVKALKYAVEDVLLLCNGGISKCLYTRKKYRVGFCYCVTEIYLNDMSWIDIHERSFVTV